MNLPPFSEQSLLWFLNKDGRGLLLSGTLTQEDAKSRFHSLPLILQGYSRGDGADSQSHINRNDAPSWPLNTVTDGVCVCVCVCAGAYTELTVLFFIIFLQSIPSREKGWNSEPPHLPAPDPWTYRNKQTPLKHTFYLIQTSMTSLQTST